MNILKALGGVNFTKYALLPISQYVHWKKIGSFMRIYNMSVTYLPSIWQMNILKALGGVDFTKYALLPISQYVQWSKIGYVKNSVNLSKIFFSANKFFMHIYNMSVTCLLSIK